jgi:hypothetical protein
MARVPGLWARYEVLKLRGRKLYAVYGVAAVVTWFGLFFIVLAGFVIAVEYSNGPGTNKGGWLAAYVATEATKPIRILVTLALTPMVAQVGRRIRGTKAAPEPAAEKADENAA